MADYSTDKSEAVDEDYNTNVHLLTYLSIYLVRFIFCDLTMIIYYFIYAADISFYRL